MNEITPPRSFSRLQGFILSATVLFCFLLVHITGRLAEDRINDNRREAALRVLREIIPGQYDNDIFTDSLQVNGPDNAGSDKPVTVFRARTGTNALGVVYYPVTVEGYKGPIELGIGIDRNGRLTGVRVLRQQETEGLGAEVDQNNSNWIRVFDGLSYAEVPREQWDLRSENGYFDQISGATITSRSVINAVRNTLDYHQLAGEDLYK